MMSPRAADVRLDPEATEFVRFCYRRRSVGWPELYDEMCAVASRRLFRGWDQTALGEHGVGFGLFELPALAALTAAVVAEEHAARSARRPGRESPRRDPLPTADGSIEVTVAPPSLDPSLRGQEASAHQTDDRATTLATATTSAASADPATEPADRIEALALAS